MDLYVVEPQTLFVSYLSDVLARAGMDVVRIASAFDLGDIERSQPGAVFVDADFLETDPVDAVRNVRAALPNALIFAYVSDETPAAARALTKGGANCVLSKESTATEVVTGIRQAVETGRFVDPRIADAPEDAAQDEVRYVDFRERRASETKT